MKNISKFDTMAQRLNQLTFNDYYTRLSLLAKTLFKWENLPNGISEKWIERYLFDAGNCVFFHDEIKGFMVAKCSTHGRLNPYDDPVKVRPYATHYKGEPLRVGKECVLIRNNEMSAPTRPTLELYAYRLTDITRAIDVNIKAQKRPNIILCNEKQKNSLKRLMEKVDDNEVAIYGDNNLDVNGITTIKNEVPAIFPQLQLQKHQTWNECLTFLGINNANQDKRERLVANEVEANNDNVDLSANVFLKERLDAVEQINKLFKLNIKVSVRELEESEVTLND